MTGRNRQGLATRGIHAGQSPDPTTGAIMPPIYADRDLRPVEPRRAQGL